MRGGRAHDGVMLALAWSMVILLNGCVPLDRPRPQVVGTTLEQRTAFDQFTNREAVFRDHYQTHYAGSGYDYNQYRPAYQHGFDLGLNPRYRGKDWRKAEAEAHRTWDEATKGSWDRYKDAVRYGWEQGILLERG